MGKRTFGCVKWLLTSFNLIFLICGLAICGFGVWMLVSPDLMSKLLGKNLTPVISYIMLGIGGTIILISFCGCAGAGLENRCLLCLFFTVLCGIFVACLVSSILVAIFKKDLGNMTSERLTNNLVTNYGVSEVWTDLWNHIQSKLQCCGVVGESPHQIFEKTQWYKTYKPKKVPESCCNTGRMVNKEECQKGTVKYIHTTGCMSVAMVGVVEQTTVAIVVLVTLTLVLILGMVLSLVHLSNINYNSRYTDYSQPI